MDTSIITQTFNFAIYDLMMRLREDVSSESGEDGISLSGIDTGSASGQFASLVEQASKRYQVPVALIDSVIQAESGFNPKAVSPVGAAGLMQLMPGTARSLGVHDVMDPAQNIDGGVHFLRELLDRYHGNIRLAVAAYNAGPGAVDKYGDVPPYAETRLYVQRVLGNYHRLNVEA